MSKNIVITVLLVVVVIIGFGFYLSNNNNQITTPPSYTSTNVPVVQQPAAPDNSVPLTPSAPIVQTSQNNISASNSTAALSGDVNPDGVSTTYWFEYSETSSLGNRSIEQAIGSGYSSIQATGFITGLKLNTLYYYRLSAKNSFGTVNGMIYSFQTNNNPPPQAIKSSVKTNSATSVTNTTATINGQVNPNGTATSYWYEYGKDTNFGFVTAFLGTNSGSSYMSVPTPISSLQPLTKYYFRLNAQNQFGTVNGSVASFTTTGPATASKPTVETSSAISINSSNAVFVGRINPNGDDTTYWFEYSNNSLLSNLIGSGTSQVTIMGNTGSQVVQTSVTSLQPNTKYYYHLVGKNQYGTVYGGTVSFTTKK